MKKLLCGASALVLFAALANAAHAECDGIYGAFRGGVTEHDGTSEGGKLDDHRLMLSGALGYRYEYFRAELEYVWRKHAKDEAKYVGNTLKFKTYSYMFNMYYDVLPYNWWSPYVGLGLGWTKMKYTDIDHTSGFDTAEKTTRFTWALGAGLSLKVTNRLNVDLGYRYYNMGKLEGKEDIKANEVYGGLRYVF